MLLLGHIIIALTSLVFATLLIIRPSRTGMMVSNILIISTLLSGGLLLFDGAHVLHLCLSGFFYSVVAVGMTIAARRRLQAVVVS